VAPVLVACFVRWRLGLLGVVAVVVVVGGVAGALCAAEAVVEVWGELPPHPAAPSAIAASSAACQRRSVMPATVAKLASIAR
jgi:hypothetical protein